MTYYTWHRPPSLSRFLSYKVAIDQFMQDIDSVEACRLCHEPLALVEIAIDTGQSYKNTEVLKSLAMGKQIPAFCLFYSRRIVGTVRCPQCDGTGKVEVADVASFRVRYVWPKGNGTEEKITPQQWAEFLKSLRSGHTCKRDLP